MECAYFAKINHNIRTVNNDLIQIEVQFQHQFEYKYLHIKTLLIYSMF